MIVKNLGLETIPYPKPCPLGWVCVDAKLQVTRQCRFKFVIPSKLVDEVELDVVPLDIYGIILGCPYLYDMNAILFRQENKCHLTKGGVEYIVKAHNMKKLTLVSAGQMKRSINASKKFVLIVLKEKYPDKYNSFDDCDPSHKDEMIDLISNYDEFF